MPDSKDLLHLTGYTAIAGVKAVKTAIVVPFKGKHRHGSKPYINKVLYEIINDYMLDISIAEVQLIHPSTHTSYQLVCLRKGLKQRENVLPNNTKAYWLNYNEKTKKNVLVWFHGGGYILPCTDGHVRFLYSDLVKKTGNKYAVCILAYTLAPEKQYPTQLIQASTLINYLISQERIHPRDIVIGGDSAGGNLALGLLGHATHPHPACPKLLLREGDTFRAALLMSPWVTFDSTSPSMIANETKDYICRRSLRKWHEAFLGSAKLDAYNTPLDAPQEWWQGVPVKSILFTGGGDELFRSDIQALGTKIQGVHPRTKVTIFLGDVHDQPFIDRILYMKTGRQCKNIVSWISTLEIPGFESDRPMNFSQSLSLNSYRALSSYTKQPHQDQHQNHLMQQHQQQQQGRPERRLQKTNMSAALTPLESPDESLEGRFEHMSSNPYDGRLPSENILNLGSNIVDAFQVLPEPRDTRVDWDHPLSMQVLHARHSQNSVPKPQTPPDYARLHREENAKYARELRERHEKDGAEMAAKMRDVEERQNASRQSSPNHSPPRQQLSDPAHQSPMTMHGGRHPHILSCETTPTVPQDMPMPASSPRSDEFRQFMTNGIPAQPVSPPRSEDMHSTSSPKPLPLEPHSPQSQPRQLSIPHFQDSLAVSLRDLATYSQMGGSLDDRGTMGSELSHQLSCHSVKSQQSRPETVCSLESREGRVRWDGSVRSGDCGKGEVSPIEDSGTAERYERLETPQVHEAGMKHAVRTSTGDARESETSGLWAGQWHEVDARDGRPF